MSKLVDIGKIGLDKTESLEIAGFTNKAKEKYELESSQTDTLNTMIGNVYKQFKVFNESNTSIVQADVEPFRDMAVLATVKFFQSTILEKLASFQTTDSPYGLVTYIDFAYGDDYAPDNIKADDKLSEKRSRTYGSHPVEQSLSRRIKTKVAEKPIQAEIRSIEASYTLEAFLAMSAIKGQNTARQFLDRKYLNVIANKLRDEAEFAVVDAGYRAVRPDNIVSLPSGGADCEEQECNARRVLDGIEEAGQTVYDKYKLQPNVVVVGSDMLKIIRRGEAKIISGYEKGTGIPSSVARNYMGVLDDRYALIYDPELSGALLTWKDTTSDYGSSIVYTSVVPLAITAPITERDLSTYRVVYSVDSVDVIHPQLIARVDLL